MLVSKYSGLACFTVITWTMQENAVTVRAAEYTAGIKCEMSWGRTDLCPIRVSNFKNVWSLTSSAEARVHSRARLFDVYEDRDTFSPPVNAALLTAMDAV